MTSWLCDGLGNRLSQTVNGTVTRYVNDPAAGLTQALSDGTRTYLYGVGRIAQQGTNLQYFGADGLGSVRQLYNSTGQIIYNRRYDPFGNSISQSGVGTTPYGFAGEWTDGTGLEYLRARYYSAVQGRFVSRDVWSGDASMPMSYNAWLYVYANPVNLTDPSGKCEENGDEACWGVYEQIIRICPECATTMSWPPGTGDQPLHKANIHFLEVVLQQQLRLHSANPDREDFAQQNAELMQRVLPVVKEQAAQFGLPWQVAAGILDTERQLDWNWNNEHRELAYQALGPDAVLALGLSRSGNNPGAGIANIHADTARSVAQYFAGYEELTRCVYWELPVSPDDLNNKVVKALEIENNSIRMMTAYVRQLADFRFGSNGQPLKTSHADLADWMLADAVAIWHGYRYGVPGVSPEGQGSGFASLSDFQDRSFTPYQLINQVITGAGNARQSAEVSAPILEKYLQMQ